MDYQKITAFFRCENCETVERALRDIGVKGFSISQVKGYGEYADLYRDDWLVTHARIEIFAVSAKVDKIVAAIMDAAHVGLEGDGIVAVTPVEKLYRIRTRGEIAPEDL